MARLCNGVAAGAGTAVVGAATGTGAVVVGASAGTEAAAVCAGAASAAARARVTGPPDMARKGNADELL